MWRHVDMTVVLSYVWKQSHILDTERDDETYTPRIRLEILYHRVVMTHEFIVCKVACACLVQALERFIVIQTDLAHVVEGHVEKSQPRSHSAVKVAISHVILLSDVTVLSH